MQHREAAWKVQPRQVERESVSPKTRSLLETGENTFNKLAKLRKKTLTPHARVYDKGPEICGDRSSQSLVIEKGPEQFPVKKCLPVWS